MIRFMQEEARGWMIDRMFPFKALCLVDIEQGSKYQVSSILYPSHVPTRHSLVNDLLQPYKSYLVTPCQKVLAEVFGMPWFSGRYEGRGTRDAGGERV